MTELAVDVAAATRADWICSASLETRRRLVEARGWRRGVGDQALVALDDSDEEDVRMRRCCDCGC